MCQVIFRILKSSASFGRTCGERYQDQISAVCPWSSLDIVESIVMMIILSVVFSSIFKFDIENFPLLHLERAVDF